MVEMIPVIIWRAKAFGVNGNQEDEISVASQDADLPEGKNNRFVPIH